MEKCEDRQVAAGAAVSLRVNMIFGNDIIPDQVRSQTSDLARR